MEVIQYVFKKGGRYFRSARNNPVWHEFVLYNYFPFSAFKFVSLLMQIAVSALNNVILYVFNGYHVYIENLCGSVVSAKHTTRILHRERGMAVFH